MNKPYWAEGVNNDETEVCECCETQFATDMMMISVECYEKLKGGPVFKYKARDIVRWSKSPNSIVMIENLLIDESRLPLYYVWIQGDGLYTALESELTPWESNADG